MVFRKSVGLEVLAVIALSLVLVSTVAGKVVESRQASDVGREAEKLCARLAEIKVLPFKGERVDDEVYNGLLRLGREAIPCLLDKITDTSRMKDPRKTPIYHNFRVGDVAFFVFLEISGVPLEEMLTASVRRRFAEEGVYAYFRYVENHKNRESLQRKCRNYFSKSSTK